MNGENHFSKTFTRVLYESYINAVDLISVLQAKARAWLEERGHPYGCGTARS